MAWRGKKNFQGSIGNTILTVSNAAYCYKRRSAVLLRVGRRVATFSLFQSGYWGTGRSPQPTGVRGYDSPENFWNSMCDLVRFAAIWWLQLYVGHRTRYICNFAIKIEPICRLQCPHDCILQCYRCSCLVTSMPRNPKHSASRGWSCWDAELHGTNPGHPGKSGTGGNPSWSHDQHDVLCKNG